MRRVLECGGESNAGSMSLPFFLVIIESGYPVPNFVSEALRIRRFSLVPDTIVALSCASRGITGIVATLDEESVLAFIAATMMSFVGKERISFVLSLIGM